MDSTSTCNTKLLEKDTQNLTNSQNLSYLNHQLIKSNQIHSAEKLSAKELDFISFLHETFGVETYLYSSSYYHNGFKVENFTQYSIA